jgi:flagellar assembly protein FliH
VADLPVSSEMIEAVVKEACAEVDDTSEFTVLLNPDDFALMQETSSSLLSLEGGQEQIHFQTSPQVSRGGCIVQTRFGTLDARRETRFEMLRQSLGA